MDLVKFTDMEKHIYRLIGIVECHASLNTSMDVSFITDLETLLTDVREQAFPELSVSAIDAQAARLHEEEREDYVSTAKGFGTVHDVVPYVMSQDALFPKQQESMYTTDEQVVTDDTVVVPLEKLEHTEVIDMDTQAAQAAMTGIDFNAYGNVVKGVRVDVRSALGDTVDRVGVTPTHEDDVYESEHGDVM